MVLSIDTNLAAMSANHSLARSNDSLARSLARLSRGYRINSAADDAAGWASPKACARRSPA
jgi:flagellin